MCTVVTRAGQMTAAGRRQSVGQRQLHRSGRSCSVATSSSLLTLQLLQEFELAKLSTMATMERVLH